MLTVWELHGEQGHWGGRGGSGEELEPLGCGFRLLLRCQMPLQPAAPAEWPGASSGHWAPHFWETHCPTLRATAQENEGQLDFPVELEKNGSYVWEAQ